MGVRKARVTSKGQITIPLEIRKALKLREGDTVSFEVKDDCATLRLAESEDPFAAWAGAWREGKGLSLEAIIAKERKERGW